MQIQTITQQDIANLEQIIQQKPDYIEIDFDLIKQKSARVVSPSDKPKKKKNLELELLANKPKPVLNLNLKSQNTKVIISTCLKTNDLNYRKLRAIKKHIKAYNPFAIKITAQPTNDVQNNNLIRLLVSKTKQENMLVDVSGKYEQFWSTHRIALGNMQI